MRLVEMFVEGLPTLEPTVHERAWLWEHAAQLSDETEGLEWLTFPFHWNSDDEQRRLLAKLDEIRILQDAVRSLVAMVPWRPSTRCLASRPKARSKRDIDDMTDLLASKGESPPDGEVVMSSMIRP